MREAFVVLSFIIARRVCSPPDADISAAYAAADAAPRLRDAIVATIRCFDITVAIIDTSFERTESRVRI